MEEKYGEVEEMNVCDNLGDHLVGNVYVKVGLNAFTREVEANSSDIYMNECDFKKD